MAEFNDNGKRSAKGKYSDTELASTLLEYFTDNTETKITPLGLEKEQVLAGLHGKDVWVLA